MIDHVTLLSKINAFIQFLKVERNLSCHTQRAYLHDLQQFATFWQSLSPSEINNLTFRQLLERYLGSLYYKKLNKSSIARKYSCFSSFEKFLTSEGITLDLHLARPLCDKKLPAYLTVDEIFYLLDTVKDHELPTRQPLRDKAIFELMYATGIRCSELVAITLADLDFGQKTVTIKGTRKKLRIALFGKKAKERILAYLSHERKQAIANNEPLFLNHSNEQLTCRSIQRTIAMFGSFLPNKRLITPQQLRHSFAIHLAQQGVDIRVIQELLGNKSSASTEQYAQIILDELHKMCNTNVYQNNNAKHIREQL